MHLCEINHIIAYFCKNVKDKRNKNGENAKINWGGVIVVYFSGGIFRGIQM